MIRIFQTKIAQWVDHNFPSQDLSTTALNLTEEVGEVARCIIKKTQGIRPEVWGDLPDELADVFISLCATAAKAGIDLQDAIDMRLPQILMRDWTKKKEEIVYGF